MKVLLLTQEPPLSPDEVVTGNAVRTLQLSSAIRGAGHRIDHAWLCKSRTRDNRHQQFRNSDDLQAIITGARADAILVTYWELLDLMPYDASAPVVLDFVAPRPLEELYESPQTVGGSVRRLRNALRRCDLVLVGNPLQKHLLINTLIEGGFDLRHDLPLAVVPLGSEPQGPPQAHPARHQLTLVAGGVSWPWRTEDDWSEALTALARTGTARVVIFAGRYRWHADDSEVPLPDPGGNAKAGPSPQVRELVPYAQFSEFLSKEAHIGVELSAWTIERAYSQSFRSLEFLRHGLPLICNRFLPISALIEQYDAGWLVEDPAELPGIVESVQGNPEFWEQKSAGALKLVANSLSPEATTGELLRWLDHPTRAERLDKGPGQEPVPPVLGVPPLADRIRRQFTLIRQFGLARLFGLAPSGKEGRNAKSVIIVTRADLFPPDHGAAVRTLQTAHALARRGFTVGLVTDDRRRWYSVDENQVTPHPYPWWLRFLSLPGPLAKLLHHSRDIPHSNSFLYLPLSDGSYFWRILAADGRLRAGILQAEFPAYARPCIEAGEVMRCPVVLVEHNVEYERLRNQVGELSEAQYQRFRSIEIDLCSRVGAVVCVSDNDRRRLERDGVRPESLHTIPHGVSVEDVDRAAPVDAHRQFSISESDPLLVFHGTFSYPPNREAIAVLSEKILPGLEALGIQAHVLAVGRDAPTSTPHPRVHFTGSVPEVGPWIKAADIAVIPLLEGGGTRMKILDCFAARIPVVTTSKGIEGIPVRHGKEALIEDKWPAFIQAIADLIGDPELNRTLSESGHAYANTLDWSEIAGRYARLYSRL